MPKSTQNLPLISMVGVGVQQGNQWLVRGVDLSISRGEIVTLIGPNGSGKSTTAKVATGVLPASVGRVERRNNLRIGYVPQKLHIDWALPLSVERLMELTKRHSTSDVHKALELVGAEHLLGAAVQSLSGGEFQRVLLARAMIGKPDVLVLDEPVQGVDFAGQVTLYNLITQIRDETQCGVLMISHDLHVVMAATDQVICLNGHVCCSGPAESVARSPEYLSLFGARAAETLAIYQHHHDHTHLPNGRVQHADGCITHEHDAHDHGEEGHTHVE